MSAPNTDTPYQLLPPLTEEEFALLKQDIAHRGVLVPIERDEHGSLLDGHHRLRAVQELQAEGVEVADPSVLVRVGLTEAEKRSHVRALNVQRRHLTAAQRRALVEAQLKDTPDVSDRSLAASLSTSPTTVGMIRRRLEGSVSVQNGQLATRLGRDGRRRRMPTGRTLMAASDAEASRALEALKVVPLAALPERIITAADATVAARMARRENSREERMERLRDAGDLPRPGRGRYAVLYLDPPWRYTGASDPTRVAENHYPTMSHPELMALPVSSIAARSAVMYMWTTPPKVGEAVELVSAWGFEYKTCAVWDKEIPGLGSWFRQQHELLLVATRGNMPAPAPAHRPPSVIRSPRGKHSAKPEIVRQQIERMFPGVPKGELFARGTAPGWDVWGFEAETERVTPRAG